MLLTAGQLNINSDKALGSGRLTLSGILNAAGGTYAAYGQKLEIEREKAFYDAAVREAEADFAAAREAQAAFNAWVRARDAGMPCISCQRHHTGQYHAGHYLSRGARPELAYEPDNCHKQCAPCNTHLSGNVALYRGNLIKLIGLDRVEWLEGPHPAKHYSIEDLREIKELYKRKLKELNQ